MESSTSMEYECRVCRGEGEPDRPLYTPCLCSGSIGLVHQDCLEAWLAHSKKDKCELCSAKYQFVPRYAPNMPNKMPWSLILRSTLNMMVRSLLPWTVRLICVVIVWIGLVPFNTWFAYRYLIRKHVDWDVYHMIRYPDIVSNIQYGIILDALIALSLLILMSFTDFLRLNWIQAPNNNNNNNAANAGPPRNNPQVAQPEMLELPLRAPRQQVRMREQLVDLRNRRRRTRQSQASTASLPDRQDHEQISSVRAEAFSVSHPNLSSRRITPEDPSQQIGTRGGWSGADGKEESESLGVSPLSTTATHLPSLLEDNVQGSAHSDSGDTAGRSDMAESDMFIDLLEVEEAELGSDESPYFLFEDDDNEGKNEDDMDEEEEGEAEDDGEASRDGLGDGRQLHHEFDHLWARDNEAIVADVRQLMLDLDDANFQPNRNHPEPGNNRNPMRQGANINNNNNNNAIDAEQQDVGEGLRLALFELLGLEGPLWTILRNALWLMSFINIYLGIVACFPYRCGQAILKIISVHILVHVPFFRSAIITLCQQALSDFISPCLPYFQSVVDLASWLMYPIFSIIPLYKVLSTLMSLLYFLFTPLLVTLPADFVRLYHRMDELSNQEDVPVQFTDFLFMGVGYIIIFCVVFSLDHLLRSFPSAILAGLEQTAVAIEIRNLSVMIKVCVLLVVRIFLLPLILGGGIITILSYLVLTYSIEDWASFLTVNAVGAYALAWVAGITFMLSMTISVLQLREVLHPEVFGQVIRPQEAHNDLINSLIQESGFVHTRRILISLLVYSTLMFLLLLTPLCLYHYLAYQYHVLPRPYQNIQLWYLLPTLQMPLELLVGHLTFLSALDKKKSWIGRLQHVCLVGMCKRLGLLFYLLPMPLVVRRVKTSGYGRRRLFRTTSGRNVRILPRNRAVLTQSQGNVDNNSHSNQSRNSDGSGPIREDEDEVEVVMVGKPLTRPPTGWDSQSSAVSTRWAWGNEEPSELELNLAPRITPSWWWLRVSALILLSWLLLTALGLFLLLLPIILGRSIFQSLFFPQLLVHDPICFALGLQLMILVGMVVRYVLQLMSNIRVQFIRKGRLRNMGTVIRLVWYRVVTHLAVGMIVMMIVDCLSHVQPLLIALLYHIWNNQSINWNLLRNPTISSTVFSSSWMTMATKAWFSGSFLVESCTYLALKERINCQWIGLQPVAPAALAFFFRQMLKPHVWANFSDEATGVKYIERVLVWPWFQLFVGQGVAMIWMGTLIYLALLALFGHRETLYDQWIDGQRWCSGLWLTRLLLPVMLRPLSQVWQTFNRKIRDEHYLVGQTLLNCSHEANSAAS